MAVGVLLGPGVKVGVGRTVGEGLAVGLKVSEGLGVGLRVGVGASAVGFTAIITACQKRVAEPAATVVDTLPVGPGATLFLKDCCWAGAAPAEKLLA